METWLAISMETTMVGCLYGDLFPTWLAVSIQIGHPTWLAVYRELASNMAGYLYGDFMVGCLYGDHGWVSLWRLIVVGCLYGDLS